MGAKPSRGKRLRADKAGNHFATNTAGDGPMTPTAEEREKAERHAIVMAYEAMRICMAYEAMRICMGLPTKYHKTYEVIRWMENISRRRSQDQGHPEWPAEALNSGDGTYKP
jgi:hypothetical protein